MNQGVEAPCNLGMNGRPRAGLGHTSGVAGRKAGLFFLKSGQSSQCFGFVAIGEQAETQLEARLHLIMVIIH